MQDINREETKLGDGTVNRAVGKIPLFLEPSDVITEFQPGNIFGLFSKDVLQVIQIGTDIGAVTFEGMVRKTAQRNHFSVKIKIFVHNGTSLKMVFVNRVNVSGQTPGGGRIKNKICSC